jgi:hypothetical protein
MDESSIGECIKRRRNGVLMTQDAHRGLPSGPGCGLPDASEPGITAGFRCRHLTDRACAHANLSQEDQAFALLLTAERMSPNWIRHQPLARAVTRNLLAAERRRSTPLRQRAKRIGVNR